MIVRLRGVKRVRAKGRVYYYHRVSKTRLPGVPGAAEFTAALDRLERRAVAAPKGGTLDALIAAYRQSPEYAELAESTRYKYQKVFDRLRPLSHTPLLHINSRVLYGIRDKLFAEKKRAFANLTLAVLSHLFNWGVRRELCESNPAADIEKIRRPRNARVVNRPWQPEELEVVLDDAPAWLRVPIALAAYAGLSESDVLRATWAIYDGRRFEARRKKTGVSIWVPAHYRLREILDAAPRTSPTIVLGARGRPIGRSTLTTCFFGLLRDLRQAGKVGPWLSFHGLRHTLGTALGEMGCDPATIAAVLAQETEQMGLHYSKQAKRHHLAAEAIERLETRDRKTARKTEL